MLGISATLANGTISDKTISMAADIFYIFSTYFFNFLA